MKPNAKERGAAKLLADSIIDDFVAKWVVADGGHRWVTVGKNRVLTDDASYGSKGTVYYPLNTGGLFKLFEVVEPTEAGFLAFANQYGLLGVDAVGVGRASEKPFVTGEPWSTWVNVHRRIRQAVRLWDAIQAGDLSRWVHSAGAMGDGTTKWALYDPELRDHKKPLRGVIGSRSLTERVPCDVAKRFLQGWINGGLRGHVYVRVLWHEDRARREGSEPYVVRIVPQTLLGCMWWQFARAFTGKVHYGACKVCGKPLERGPDGFMVTREFCSRACKQKDHRTRVKQAKELKAEGWSASRIARKLDTTTEAIKNWLTKAK
jgi:endogenous inhibitor of DNA gyrase (YacG/DUF329 family)